MTKILPMNCRISYLLWCVINLCLIHFSKFQVQAQCSGNGFINACACNFIGACAWNPSTNTFNAFGGSANHLKRFIPSLKHLAMPPSQVAEICEPGSFGIIYDCSNRIPIAATIVMTADQYGSPNYKRPTNDFKLSSQIGPDVQQHKVDYTQSSQRIPCFEASNGNNYVEHIWYDILNKTPGQTAPYKPCPTRPPISAIHRGHLIAANYGRGTSGRSAQTFVYTNAVPQFAKENSVSWRIFESKLLEWAKNNCGRASLHIIVGSIPSTYAYGRNLPRFFGQAGFSNYIGGSILFSGNQPYRINVPAYLWTAACCHSPSPSFTRSTAFHAPNHPKHGLVEPVKLSGLFAAVKATHVELFPGMPSCNIDANYIPV